MRAGNDGTVGSGAKFGLRTNGTSRAMPGWLVGIVHVDSTGVTVTLRDRFDFTRAQAVDRLLRGAARAAPTVVLDLQAVSLVDCSGVHVVLGADKRIRNAGGRLVILCGPPAVRRIFDITDTRRRLEIIVRPTDALGVTRHERTDSARDSFDSASGSNPRPSVA